MSGMLRNGYELSFAERCFKQIEGFADYGFPESHAASFALLVYISAWFKCHYPAAFSCALLNSLPMGFYAPAQLVRDVRDHSVEVRPMDINLSQWDCTLENSDVAGFPALRLGLRIIKGLKQSDVEILIEARNAPYQSVHDLWRRAGLGRATLECLARADVFLSMGLTRRNALWEIKAMDDTPLPLFDFAERHEPNMTLPVMSLGEQVTDDYRALTLSLKSHPLALLRSNLNARNCVSAAELQYITHGAPVRLAGLVTSRQRPGSAKGVMFITLEDETGHANLIVWPNVFERFRRQILKTSLLEVTGEVLKEGLVIHVISHWLQDLTPWLGHLGNASEKILTIPLRDFKRSHQ